MNTALVPVKRLGEGKSRLAGVLDPEALAALTLAMLGDVVEALLAVDAIDRVVVVTPDEAVADAARALGAETLLRNDPGLNPSLDAAAPLVTEATGSLLVVLGDVAGADPKELGALYTTLGDRRGAAIAPARDGGTAALLRRPPDAFAGRFGKDSAEAHRAAARDAGVLLMECDLPTLAIDLDRREDLDALLAGDGPAPRTRTLLRELGFAPTHGDPE